MSTNGSVHAGTGANKLAFVGGVGGNLLSKVKRYGWKLNGTRGEFKEIHKLDLVVDYDYQRQPNDTKIKRIASNFDWLAFGVLLVIARESSDGSSVYYVTDGGTRLLAAQHRTDIDFVPCMVFRATSMDQEATAFLVQNTERKPVTSLEKFKAEIVSGDPVAIAVQHELDRNGYAVAKSAASHNGKSVCCMAILKKCAAEDLAVFRDVMSIMGKVSEDSPILDRVFAAIFYAEVRLRRKDQTLLRKPWFDRLINLGSKRIKKCADEAVSFYGNTAGGPRVWAEGLMIGLNKGVRHQISLKAPSNSD